MAHSETYDGLVFSEDGGETTIQITFTHGVLYIAITTAFDEELEEGICEADARTLLAYLKEKLGDN